VYLVSPETAAASARRGVITDPRDLGEPPRIALPKRFLVDDRMIIPPAPEGDTVDIIRGPNIKPLPPLDPVPEILEGKVLIKLGDHISTDDILPGGAKIIPLRSNIPAISRYVFTQTDPGFADRAKAQGGGFILGGQNYGQGSSREHAALAPRHLGIRVVMARSFSRIHKANLVNVGILPLELAGVEDLSRFSTGDSLRMTDVNGRIRTGKPLAVENLTRGFTATARLDLSERFREILRAGGLLAYTREKAQK
jgi:aconitate hydratase